MARPTNIRKCFPYGLKELTKVHRETNAIGYNISIALDERPMQKSKDNIQKAGSRFGFWQRPGAIILFCCICDGGF
jgi:hypothetical protein